MSETVIVKKAKLMEILDEIKECQRRLEVLSKK